MYVIQLVVLFCTLYTISAAESESLPYRFPMLLGRGYNLTSHRIGGDLFSVNEVKKALIERNPSSSSYFSVISSNQGIGDFISINNDLSIKVKSGIIRYNGPMNYIKQLHNREKVVEILVSCRITTVKKTLRSASPPVSGCKKLLSTEKGTHYIESEQHGGLLLASLTLTAETEQDKFDLEAVVDDILGPQGVFDQNAADKMRSLKDDIGIQFSMAMAMYAIGANIQPTNNIDEFVEEIREFPKKVQEDGVPIEAELKSIDKLKGCEPNPPINWQRNSMLEDDVKDLEEKFDDIRMTRELFTEWTSSLDMRQLKFEDIRKISNFNRGLRNVDRALRTTINKLDVSMSGNPQQFYAAIDAYTGPHGDSINNKKYHYAFMQMKSEIW